MPLLIRLVRRLQRAAQDFAYWLEDVEIELEHRGRTQLTEEQARAAWMAHLAEHEAAIASVASTRDVEHGAHVDQHLADLKGGPH